MNKIFTDAASLAEDHVSLIQSQIDMFTKPPQRLAWHPVLRHRAENPVPAKPKPVTPSDHHARGVILSA